MCSHCVQTCPRFPTDLKQEGKEPPSPECWQTSPVGGRVGSHYQVQQHVPSISKDRETAALGETKAADARHPQPGCPGGGREEEARDPAHRRAGTALREQIPREGCLKPYGRGKCV